MFTSLTASGKGIALIGNPGVGKTTFLIAAIHYLDKIGWARIKFKELPPEYGTLVDLLISGKPLSPTLRMSEYALEFSNVSYKGVELKTGVFGKITFKIIDMSGQDYRATTRNFKHAVRDAFAALFLLDPSLDENFAHSLSGQILPIDKAIRYILGYERDIKYFGFIFTKSNLHNHYFDDMVNLLEEQLTPLFNLARRSGVKINIFEIDSRGKDGKLDPEGFEPIFFDTLSVVCKVKN